MPAVADARLTFFVANKLSDRLSITPAGYLLCEEVPIAKTGVMVYGPGETEVETGSEGYAEVDCPPEELFRPETIASFNAAPIVNEHPTNEDKGVTTENWHYLSKGVVLNTRRGSDTELVADLLITTSDLIEVVLGLDPGVWDELWPQLIEDDARFRNIIKSGKGKREVSCGYTADYVSDGKGRGHKVDIIGNHLAVVDSGRCGKRCAIGDAAWAGGKKRMKKSAIKKLMKRWRDAGGNEEALEKTLTTADPEELSGDDDTEMEGGHHIHVHVNGGKEDDTATGDSATRDAEMKDVRDSIARHDSDIKEIKDSLKRIEDSMKETHDARRRRRDSEEEDPYREDSDKEDEDGYLTGTDSEQERDKIEDARRKRRDSDEELEGELEEEAPEGTGDKARHARDSAYLVESYRDTVALAEIIAPGVKIPTFDAKWSPRVNYSNMCRLRRAALTQGLKDADTAEIIRGVRRKTTDAATVKKLTCDSIRTLFIAVGQLKRGQNNSRMVVTDHKTVVRTETKRPASISDLNKRNAEFYKNH